MLRDRALTLLIPVLAAVVLLCLGVSAPAHAQPDQKPRAGTPKESARMMLEFAECTASKRKYRANIDLFLRMSPANPEFSRHARTFVDNGCMPNTIGSVEMRFDAILFRYGLFEARYRNEFGRGPAPVTADLPPLDFESEFDLTFTADLRGTEALPPLIVFLRQLSHCLILERPAEAHALVIARPFSDAETKALPPVVEILGACIGEGQTLKFSRPMLRGAIAEALYKAATRRRTAAQTQSVN